MNKPKEVQLVSDNVSQVSEMRESLVLTHKVKQKVHSKLINDKFDSSEPGRYDS